MGVIDRRCFFVKQAGQQTFGAEMGADQLMRLDRIGEDVDTVPVLLAPTQSRNIKGRHQPVLARGHVRHPSSIGGHLLDQETSRTPVRRGITRLLCFSCQCGDAGGKLLGLREIGLRTGR